MGFNMRFLIVTVILFLIDSSKADAPANCSTGCWASRGECYWEEPTEPGLEPYWPYKCQDGEQGVDTDICYCGRCWGCKVDTAACPNGKCSLRSPGPNFKPNGQFCNENENCQCWEESDPPNPCRDVVDQRCTYDIGGICNNGPYLEYTDPTGYFCQNTDECQCYKKPCTDDGYCRLQYGGICNETRPSDDYYETNYMCNQVKNCTCWSRKVINDDCPTDNVCREKFNEGVCSVKMPGPDYKETSYKCPNGTDGCICWEKKSNSTPCDKKACPKVKGLKGLCGLEQPAEGFVRTDYRCEDKTKKTTDADCNCWVKDCKPKSKSKNCKGGYCYPYGMSPGASYEMDGYCNKFSKCSCWKTKSNPCKKSKACRKAGGVCVSNNEITTAMTVINAKCAKTCTCVKKPNDS